MTEPTPPMPLPEGMAPAPGVIAPQPVPVNVRVDVVEVHNDRGQAEPAARMTVYNLMGVFTIFLNQEDCLHTAAALQHVADIPRPSRLVIPEVVDIQQINKNFRNGHNN